MNEKSSLIEIKVKDENKLYDLIKKARGSNYKRKERIFQKVIKLINLNPVKILKHTFESCSLVIGLKDKESLIEICYCPEGITHWKEPEHIFFR